MDVIFETAGGVPFSVEVGFFDTVLEIKEKLQKYHGIPISSQTLILNGKVLQDDRDIEYCEIFQNTRIQLVTPSEIPAIYTTNNKVVEDSAPLQKGQLPQSFENEVSLKPQPPTPVGHPGPRKLKVMVLTKCGTRKIPVEVNASDNVGEIRKELQKLQQPLQFRLPSEGYFFIHKQNVMDDDRTFRWHGVGQGDMIEIFNGTISGGSS